MGDGFTPPVLFGEGSRQRKTRTVLQVLRAAITTFVSVVCASLAHSRTLVRAGGLSESFSSSNTSIFGSHTSRIISGGYKCVLCFIDQSLSRTVRVTTLSSYSSIMRVIFFPTQLFSSIFSKLMSSVLLEHIDSLLTSPSALRNPFVCVVM